MSAAFAWLIVLLAFILLVGVMKAWVGNSDSLWYKCHGYCQAFTIIPIFLLCVFMSWLFCMLFLIGSIGAADACEGTPDAKILAVLDDRQDSFDTIVYNFAVYYVSGCEEELLPIGLKGEIEQILDYVNSVSTFAQNIYTASAEELQNCGTDRGLIDATALTLYLQLCVLMKTLENTRDFFACTNWRPAYEEAVYNALCDNGQTGLGWIGLMQLLIVIFAMIIVTLRVAFYDEEEAGDGATGCCARCCGGGRREEDVDYPASKGSAYAEEDY